VRLAIRLPGFDLQPAAGVNERLMRDSLEYLKTELF
jgi:hypothetical protein